MLSVWKFQLDVADGPQTLDMPAGADVLRVGVQGGHPCVWARVDTSAETAPRTFVVHGTGHPVFDNETYLGSCDDPPFVWHVFEVA